jgi:hypothetical protein
MVPAVRPLGSPSMARGCARIDREPNTAKIGSADRVEVHRAPLLAVVAVRKAFPHGLGHKRKSASAQQQQAADDQHGSSGHSMNSECRSPCSAVSQNNRCVGRRDNCSSKHEPTEQVSRSI